MNNSLFCVAILVLVTFTGTAAFGCTVCHSKNPKMVRMHEALNYKDCFVCHGPSTQRSKDGAPREMLTSTLCVRCHAAPGRDVR